MIENKEHLQKIEQFSTDRERLSFVIGSIRDLLRNAYREPREQLQKVSIGKDTKEVWAMRDKLEKRIDKTMTLALNTLREKLASDERLKNYLSEINALIEAIRIMLTQKYLIRYKEHQLMTGAPRLSPGEVKEQDMMREDITEGRALLREHILHPRSGKLGSLLPRCRA